MTDRVILDRAVVERVLRLLFFADKPASEIGPTEAALRAALSAGMDGYVLVPMYVTNAAGEALDRIEVAKRLRAAGEHFGNAIAGYRDGNNKRAARGVFDGATAALDAACILEAAAAATPPLPEPAQQGDTIGIGHDGGDFIRSGPSPAPAQGQVWLDETPPSPTPEMMREATMPKGDENAPEREAERVMPKTLSAGAHAGLIVDLEFAKKAAPHALTWILDQSIAALRSSRDAALEEAWRAIDALIVRGELPGNGIDQCAERNGIVLAANVIASLKSDAP